MLCSWQADYSVRSQHIFPFLSSQLLLFVLRLGPTLCMFHRTLPCSVCFLWGFGAPVIVLDGGWRRHTGNECGGRGRHGQMGLAFGQKKGPCHRNDMAFSHAFSDQPQIKLDRQTLVHIVMKTKKSREKSGWNGKGRVGGRKGSYFFGVWKRKCQQTIRMRTEEMKMAAELHKRKEMDI